MNLEKPATGSPEVQSKCAAGPEVTGWVMLNDLNIGCSFVMTDRYITISYIMVHHCRRLVILCMLDFESHSRLGNHSGCAWPGATSPMLGPGIFGAVSMIVLAISGDRTGRKSKSVDLVDSIYIRYGYANFLRSASTFRTSSSFATSTCTVWRLRVHLVFRFMTGNAQASDLALYVYEVAAQTPNWRDDLLVSFSQYILYVLFTKDSPWSCQTRRLSCQLGPSCWQMSAWSDFEISHPSCSPFGPKGIPCQETVARLHQTCSLNLVDPPCSTLE